MRNNWKRWVLMLSLSLLCASLVGCSFRVGYAGSERVGTMTAHYLYCSESKTKTVRLGEGDQLSFSCAIEVKSGQVSLVIIDPDSEVLWQADLTADAEEEFVITAEQAGDYRIRLELSGTRGSYAVAWSKL